MLPHREKFLLPLDQGLEHADERHFFIKGGIAEGHRRLAGQHLDHFQMSFRKEIRRAALESQNADPSFLIREWNDMAGTHSCIREILAELGTSLLAVGINFVSVLRHQERFFQYCSPPQEIAQSSILRVVCVQLGWSRDSLQVNSAALVESDSG